MLGCGPSAGVPMVGNIWGECDPAEPRNQRTRPSILIETGGKSILVDSGPDMRMQMLAANVKHLDAVIFTHEHADHTLGLDELRLYSLAAGKPLDIYGASDTIESLRVRFEYMFGPMRTGYTQTFLLPHIVEPGEDLPIFGMQSFPQEHSHWTSLGLRCGRFAYSTDVFRFGEDGFEKLAGVDTWIVAALRREPHAAHATLGVVLQWIERVQPKRAILTHMNHTMDYRTLLAELPGNVEPGYDGLVIDLED